MKTKLLTICLLLFTSQVFADNKNFTDSQIKQMIIQQSINSYPGRCPCPYHAASNGVVAEVEVLILGAEDILLFAMKKMHNKYGY